MKTTTPVHLRSISKTEDTAKEEKRQEAKRAVVANMTVAKPVGEKTEPTQSKAANQTTQEKTGVMKQDEVYNKRTASHL